MPRFTVTLTKNNETTRSVHVADDEATAISRAVTKRFGAGFFYLPSARELAKTWRSRHQPGSVNYQHPVTQLFGALHVSVE